MAADSDFAKENRNGLDRPEVPGGQAGESSATGVFATISEPAVPDPAGNGAHVEMPSPFGPGTPALQAVVHPISAGQPASPEAEGIEAGSMEAMLRLLRSTAAERAPLSEGTGKPPASASEPGGFTQLLRTLPVEEIRSEPAVSTGLPETQPGPSAFPSEAPTPAPSPSAGFTQLIRSFEIPANPPDRPSGAKLTLPVTPGSQQVTSFDVEAVRARAARSAPAQAEAHVQAPSLPVPPEATVPAQSSAAGAFTQLFGTLGSTVTPAGEASAAPVPSPPSAAVVPVQEVAPSAAAGNPASVSSAGAPPAPSSSGSFTQLFQALDFGSTPVPAPQHPAGASGSAGMTGRDPFSHLLPSEEPTRAQPSAHNAPSAAGSFTQLFRTLDSPQEPTDASKARAGLHLPGSDSSGPSPFAAARALAPDWSAPPERTTHPVSREAAVSPSQMRGDLGASQVFATASPSPGSRQPEAQVPADARFKMNVEAQKTPGAPPVAPGGVGLTQLLRALDQPESRPVMPPVLHEAVPPAVSQPGAFTASYEALGRAQPPMAPAAGASATETPSSFALPRVELPAVPRPAAPVAAPTGPSQYTQILQASTLREAALRGGGETAPASNPHAQLPAFAQPSLPGVAVPQVKLPEVKVPAAASGMHKYLPLLLILIIFLLVAILVTVVVLMKR